MAAAGGPIDALFDTVTTLTSTVASNFPGLVQNLGLSGPYGTCLVSRDTVVLEGVAQVAGAATGVLLVATFGATTNLGAMFRKAVKALQRNPVQAAPVGFIPDAEEIKREGDPAVLVYGDTLPGHPNDRKALSLMAFRRPMYHLRTALSTLSDQDWRARWSLVFHLASTVAVGHVCMRVSYMNIEPDTIMALARTSGVAEAMTSVVAMFIDHQKAKHSGGATSLRQVAMAGITDTALKYKSLDTLMGYLLAVVEAHNDAKLDAWTPDSMFEVNMNVTSDDVWAVGAATFFIMGWPRDQHLIDKLGFAKMQQLLSRASYANFTNEDLNRKFNIIRQCALTLINHLGSETSGRTLWHVLQRNPRLKDALHRGTARAPGRHNCLELLLASKALGLAQEDKDAALSRKLMCAPPDDYLDRSDPNFVVVRAQYINAPTAYGLDYSQVRSLLRSYMAECSMPQDAARDVVTLVDRTLVSPRTERSSMASALCKAHFPTYNHGFLGPQAVLSHGLGRGQLELFATPYERHIMRLNIQAQGKDRALSALDTACFHNYRSRKDAICNTCVPIHMYAIELDRAVEVDGGRQDAAYRALPLPGTREQERDVMLPLLEKQTKVHARVVEQLQQQRQAAAGGRAGGAAAPRPTRAGGSRVPALFNKARLWAFGDNAKLSAQQQQQQQQHEPFYISPADLIADQQAPAAVVEVVEQGLALAVPGAQAGGAPAADIVQQALAEEQQGYEERRREENVALAAAVRSGDPQQGASALQQAFHSMVEAAGNQSAQLVADMEVLQQSCQEFQAAGIVATLPASSIPSAQQVEAATVDDVTTYPLDAALVPHEPSQQHAQADKLVAPNAPAEAVGMAARGFGGLPGRLVAMLHMFRPQPKRAASGADAPQHLPGAGAGADPGAPGSSRDAAATAPGKHLKVE